MSTKTAAYAVASATSPFSKITIERRQPKDHDVAIDILFCGVCHSDLHQARNEWGNSTFPMVPGHEIVGRVRAVGKKVTKFKVGDLAGVGCMVDSCRTCESCRDQQEQFCSEGMVGTYNSFERDTKAPTYGGYSKSMVVDEAYTLKVPANLDLARVAPLLCAGITTYSPLRHFGVKAGQKVGVVGLGGLGHMGVKLAKAFGAHVTVFTTSKAKVEDARKLGADAVVLSGDAAAMAAVQGQLHFILDTVSADHDLNAYLNLLRRDGTLALVGLPETPAPIAAFNLVLRRRRLAGSLIGGIAETQEMLDFCGKHGIMSDIELIKMQDIDQAYERLKRSDVKYRFVIDLATL